LCAGDASLNAARECIRGEDLYGKVSVDAWAGEMLPHADNSVRLLVCEPPASIPETEALRVLCPRGVACFRSGEGWRTLVKPRPEALDEWTHGEYDASNHTVSRDTRVGPPRSIQWIGAPQWTRQHEAMSSFIAMVTANGRVFYIVDEGPQAAVEAPAEWVLAARDAFSGVTLWKRPVAKWLTHYWPWKSGPSSMVRRLVAVEDEVYAPQAMDDDVAAFDGATGAVLRRYADTAAAEELMLSNGTLVVLTSPNMDSPETLEKRYLASRRANTRYDSGSGKIKDAHRRPRRILAFDAETGRELWRIDGAVLPMTTAGKEGRLVYHDGSRLRCV
jgi:outer membrane protein assembly factor BamB